MENNIIKNSKAEFRVKIELPLPSKINFLLGGELEDQEKFLQELIKKIPKNEDQLKLTLGILKSSRKLKAKTIYISCFASPESSTITIKVIFDNFKALTDFHKEFNL